MFNFCDFSDSLHCILCCNFRWYKRVIQAFITNFNSWNRLQAIRKDILHLHDFPSDNLPFVAFSFFTSSNCSPVRFCKRVDLDWPSFIFSVIMVWRRSCFSSLDALGPFESQCLSSFLAWFKRANRRFFVLSIGLFWNLSWIAFFVRQDFV